VHNVVHNAVHNDNTWTLFSAIWVLKVATLTIHVFSDVTLSLG